MARKTIEQLGVSRVRDLPDGFALYVRHRPFSEWITYIVASEKGRRYWLGWNGFRWAKSGDAALLTERHPEVMKALGPVA
jgi:hypothetical protein